MPAPVQVGGEAGHQVAGAVAVEKAHFLVLQHREKPPAQVEHHVLRTLFQAHDHQIPQAFPQDLGHQHDGEQPEERLGILRDNHLVDELGRQCRIDQKHHARHHRNQQRRDDTYPVFSIHVAPNPSYLEHTSPPLFPKPRRAGTCHAPRTRPCVEYPSLYRSLPKKIALFSRNTKTIGGHFPS